LATKPICRSIQWTNIWLASQQGVRYFLSALFNNSLFSPKMHSQTLMHGFPRLPQKQDQMKITHRSLLLPNNSRKIEVGVCRDINRTLCKDSGRMEIASIKVPVEMHRDGDRSSVRRRSRPSRRGGIPDVSPGSTGLSPTWGPGSPGSQPGATHQGHNPGLCTNQGHNPGLHPRVTTQGYTLKASAFGEPRENPGA